jgi:low temperature requirement protein LtrA
LRVGGEAGGRHATWLELFFDLVFVVAIAALAGLLHDDVSLGGFVAFALLFVPVGWAWMSFAYYADQYDTDDALFRVLMLAAMLASAVLAVNVGGALAGGVGFVMANVVLRALLVLLYAWAWRSAPEGRPMSARYGTAFIVGAALWLLSLVLPEPARYVLWALALLIEMGTPVFGYSVARAVPGHASHMPERFGLFTILVLGESIIVLASGVLDAEWRLGSSLAAVGGFVVAACLWWLYFDRVDEEAIGQAFTSGVAGVVKSHVWGYGHLAVWAGIAAVAVGAEFAVVESPELALGPRVALCGGVALYLISVSAIQAATPTSLPPGILGPRLVAAAVALALVPLGALLGAPAVVWTLAAALVVLTILEARYGQQPAAATEGAGTP